MPNIAAVLKDEIRRLARKEIKGQMQVTKKVTAQSRREIAALKKQLTQQQKKLKSLQTQLNRQLGSQESSQPKDGIRFSARSVKAQRKRLGLSAQDYGRLIGVTGLTIYNWEQGKSRPRQQQLAAFVEVRGIGKREAAKKLESPNGKA